ncbi:hypothetical protein JZ751_027703, partial [Albula glossodonta]
MRAMLHAISFFLICAGAYYIALVFQAPKEELSLTKHVTNSLGSQEAQSSEEADAQEHSELDTPSESISEVTAAPGDVLELPPEVPQDQEEEIQEPNPLARGWGEDIDWAETYMEALGLARSRQKPLMVIHHLEECPTCTSLKAEFSENEEIQKMAKEDFIMFNLQGTHLADPFPPTPTALLTTCPLPLSTSHPQHETNDRNLAPDGYYVPRIIFVDPALVVRIDITGKSNVHKYSYTSADTQLCKYCSSGGKHEESKDTSQTRTIVSNASSVYYRTPSYNRSLPAGQRHLYPYP